MPNNFDRLQDEAMRYGAQVPPGTRFRNLSEEQRKGFDSYMDSQICEHGRCQDDPRADKYLKRHKGEIDQSGFDTIRKREQEEGVDLNNDLYGGFGSPDEESQNNNDDNGMDWAKEKSDEEDEDEEEKSSDNRNQDQQREEQEEPTENEQAEQAENPEGEGRTGGENGAENPGEGQGASQSGPEQPGPTQEPAINQPVGTAAEKPAEGAANAGKTATAVSDGATAGEGLANAAGAVGTGGELAGDAVVAGGELAGEAVVGGLALGDIIFWILIALVVLLIVLFVFMAIFKGAAGTDNSSGTPSIICVDAGHPPQGAGGEPELTLKVALDLQKALETEGYKVIMTRSDASPVSISDRPKACIAGGAQFMYSLHADDTPRSGGYPYQIYPKSSRTNISTMSKQDAQSIATAVGKAVAGIPGLGSTGGICEEQACTAISNLGIFSGANTGNMPAVLTEMIQLVGGKSSLDDPGNRKKLVDGIVAGIKTVIAPRTSSGGTSSTGGNARPANVVSKGKGWTLKENTDYSGVSCASGSTDNGTYRHPTRGFTIRKCGTSMGIVASIISQRTVDMIAAAKKDGVTLSGSGFRSYDEQLSVYNQNCSGGSCSPPTAKPGNSQHERALAVDFDRASKGGAVWNWLSKNGANYGYINLPSEYWHWSMSGN